MAEHDIMTDLDKGKTIKIKLDKVQMKKLMELRNDDQEGLIAILKDCGVIKSYKKEK